MPNEKRCKAWCLTWNNPPGDCLGFTADMEFMICGLEKGEKEQTEHIQGYVYFKVGKRFTYVKRLWPLAHIEPAKGKPQANVEYCSKDGKWHDHGKMPKGQGARTDLEHVRELVDAGKGTEDIRSECYGTYIRYQNAVIRDVENHRADRGWPTELHILWGVTGTGKSRFCYENFPDAFWKVKGPWWDGYDGHETVIIDEFYGWLPVDEMLRLADRYPMRVQVKGATRKFVARRIYVTSNGPWTDWWSFFRAPESDTHERLKAAFQRRITSVTEFKSMQ